MVAYNFMKSLAPLVEAGVKSHTIRNNNRNGRHAKVGDKLQLYTGMRTKSCRKLRDTICLAIHEIKIENPAVRILIDSAWVELSASQVLQLAIADGFASIDEFFNYFTEPRDLVLIVWDEVAWLEELWLTGDPILPELCGDELLGWLADLQDARADLQDAGAAK